MTTKNTIIELIGRSQMPCNLFSQTHGVHFSHAYGAYKLNGMVHNATHLSFIINGKTEFEPKKAGLVHAEQKNNCRKKVQRTNIKKKESSEWYAGDKNRDYKLKIDI